MVLRIRIGEAGRLVLSEFLRENGVESIPFDDRHADVAAVAFARFGKGRHPARLNYGDCMTYATARLAEMPLLFTGRDFSRTDLRAA
jgi:ribonuclease VapC